MKHKKLTEEQLRKRRDAAFRRKIRNIFTGAGFISLNTTNKHVKIGNRTIEIDAVFFYENIILICEDTGAISKDKDHIRKKKETFDEIDKNFAEFYKWLCLTFPENKKELEKYDEDRYQKFNLYISLFQLDLTNDELKMYPKIRFIEPKTLNYFYKMVQSIKLSARYEIFRFLDVKRDQIGLVSSEDIKKTIKATIIYPKESTGISNGVRVVSFMMSAESLLHTCYVMRKDNWEDSMWLYQRLLNREKIKSIRNFMVQKGEAFYNNIIVGLPEDVRFIDVKGDSIAIDKIANYEQCKLEIPDEMNSICVIDGQHRIFAHYEGPESDKQEKKIARLRKQLHLLVTGLIFPQNMPPIERAQIQSEIFLDINSNAKPVEPDVLLHIEMIKDPFSDIGLARRVIEKLNKERIFLNRFELSLLDESKIKVASIIKFALRYLVTIKPGKEKVSFFTYWQGDKTAFNQKSEVALNDYIDFCVKNLGQYFSAVRNNFKEDWENQESKMLSTTSINGFIIAYNRQLPQYGIREFGFYDQKFKNLEVDFGKEAFQYTSSQYRKFSNQILEKAFGIEFTENDSNLS